MKQITIIIPPSLTGGKLRNQSSSIIELGLEYSGYIKPKVRLDTWKGYKKRKFIFFEFLWPVTGTIPFETISKAHMIGWKKQEHDTPLKLNL